jgi:hypothetical protein
MKIIQKCTSAIALIALFSSCALFKGTSAPEYVIDPVAV